MERNQVTPVDFFINRRPESISFDCPHCSLPIELPWSCVDEPEYWGDDWGWVECPFCDKEVKLGDYDL